MFPSYHPEPLCKAQNGAMRGNWSRIRQFRQDRQDRQGVGGESAFSHPTKKYARARVFGRQFPALQNT